MKVWNYVIITSTICLFFTLTGFLTGFDTMISTLLNINYDKSTGLIGNIGLTISNIYNYLFLSSTGLFTTLGVALSAVVAGFFTKSSTENLLLGAFASATLIQFISTWVILMQQVAAMQQNWLTGIIIIIFAPLTIGFIVSLAEFLRGTD